MATKTEISDFAKNLTPAELAYFLESRCNSFQTEYRHGKEVGKALHFSHHTLQATVFRYILGVVVGIGEGQTYTDGRNEQAVTCAKEISKLIEDGVLNIGYMI